MGENQGTAKHFDEGKPALQWIPYESLIEVAKEKPSNFELLKQELIQKLFNNREYIFGIDQQ